MGRGFNTVRNAGTSIAGHLFQSILQFACRSVFIHCLQAEYLGVNGLFSNILSVLSLSDLGFSTAIAFSLYAPIAQNDTKQIVRLMNLYKIVYRCIAIFIMTVGLLLIPFLPKLIADRPNIPNITLLYVLYLADTAASYLLSYKRTLIEANQKSYICVVYQKSVAIAQNLLQIIFLLLTHNFIVYLLIQILCNLTSNVLISGKANRMYPFIKSNQKELPPRDELKGILKNTAAMSCHKVGSVIVSSTDNILISSLAGLMMVGLYSNYSLIVGNITVVTNMIMNGMSASIGNLVANESKEKIFRTYKCLNFAGFWLYGFCSAALFTLLTPFITLWIGSNFVMDGYVVAIVCVNFYIFGMRQVNLKFKEAMGLLWQDRYKALIEAGINLVASIILGRMFGVLGILLGTFISTVTTSFWVEPVIVFKDGLKENPWLYFKYYIIYSIGQLISVGSVVYICNLLPLTLFAFIARMVIVIVLYNGIIILLFGRREEFKDVQNLVKALVKR